MKEVLKFIQTNIMDILAMVAEEKPKARLFRFMFTEDNEFYFFTNNTNDVYNRS